MGLARTGDETRQVQMVCLDDLVAADDPYRRIERVVSWEAVRACAAPFYAAEGRYSVCPAVLLKLFVVCAVEGLGSMRETLRRAERDLAIRRFLGYGLGERLPSHATVSYAQCVRFAQSSVFEQLFTQVLAACREAGLLEGRRLVVDATHVEANAALRSLRGELAAASDADAAPLDAAGPGEASVQAAPLRLAEPRSGPTPRRSASNATAISQTDADAKLRHKPGQRPHLVHRAQVATDPKRRVIVGVAAEPATGHEGDAVAGLVRRARWAGHAVDELAADQGYAAAHTYDQLAALGVQAFIPPQPRMRTPQADAARARCRTATGRAAAVDRQAHGEGAIAELKHQHATHRARGRGTRKLQIQLLLAATAVNLKRLLAYSDAGQQAAAGNDHSAPAARRLLQIIRWCLDTLAAPPNQTRTLTGS